MANDTASILALAEAIAQTWSVRELERRVRQGNATTGAKPTVTPSAPANKSANVKDLERRLSAALGTSVRIVNESKKGQGSLTIK
ncbi:MAG: hypothetical protein R3A47_08090 [Polyangiales bacterium]